MKPADHGFVVSRLTPGPSPRSPPLCCFKGTPSEPAWAEAGVTPFRQVSWAPVALEALGNPRTAAWASPLPGGLPRSQRPQQGCTWHQAGLALSAACGSPGGWAGGGQV